MFILENDKRMCQEIFSHLVEVTESMYLRNISELCASQRNWKEIGTFKLHMSLR